MFRYWYRDNDGVITEFTDRVDRKEHPLEVTIHADEGSVGMSTITIDDPDGDFLIRNHRKIFVTTTVGETSTNRTVYVGYSQSIRTIRMDPWTSRARQIIVDVADLNTVLNRRIMTGVDTSRPAETDVARVQWLEATNEGSLIDSTTLIQTDDPVDMDDAPDAYLGQQFIDVLSDCANQSGKNYYLTNIDTGDSNTGDYNLYHLWYGADSSTAYASSIKLTNVEADLATDTWMIYTDSEIERSGDRVHSGGYLAYQGSYAYAQRQSTAQAFAQIDRSLNGENVRTKTKALARINRELTDHAVEEERITCTVRIAESRVNALREGHRVQVKLTHSDNQTDWTWCRVMRRTIREVPGSGMVEITYTLAAPPEAAPSVAVSGILRQSKGPFSDVVWWSFPGDSPHAGYPLEPTTGLVEPIEPGSPPNAIWPYTGWKVTGTGTVDVTLFTTATGVLIDNIDYTITAAICLNGTIVASQVKLASGFLKGWAEDFEVSVSTLAVAPDDEITATLVCSPPTMPFFMTPYATGQAGERLQITDGVLA